jgi:phosphoesterase RecJ-like protein
MNLEDKLKLAYSRLMSSSRVLVVGHVSPDPDALASVGAILELLISKKVNFKTYASNKINDLYDFIPHEDLIFGKKDFDLQDFSSILVLDCGSLSRTGLEDEIKIILNKKRRPFIIEIDHHQPFDSYADLEIRLPDRASTTEIIYEFFQINKLEINKRIAECILIGLMSDTGYFIHPNSSFKALEVSSQMLLKGASLQKIGTYIKGSSSLLSLKIWGKAFAKLKYNSVTKLASLAFTENDLLDLDFFKHQAKLADIFGDIVSFMSYLPGVDVSLLLREEDGVIKGSLRSNSEVSVDVSYIAKLFGGGGHKRAAGFSIKGRLKETVDGWKIIKK